MQGQPRRCKADSGRFADHRLISAADLRPSKLARKRRVRSPLTGLALYVGRAELAFAEEQRLRSESKSALEAGTLAVGQRQQVCLLSLPGPSCARPASSQRTSSLAGVWLNGYNFWRNLQPVGSVQVTPPYDDCIRRGHRTTAAVIHSSMLAHVATEQSSQPRS